MDLVRVEAISQFGDIDRVSDRHHGHRIDGLRNAQHLAHNGRPLVVRIELLPHCPEGEPVRREEQVFDCGGAIEELVYLPRHRSDVAADDDQLRLLVVAAPIDRESISKTQIVDDDKPPRWLAPELAAAIVPRSTFSRASSATGSSLNVRTLRCISIASNRSMRSLCPCALWEGSRGTASQTTQCLNRNTLVPFLRPNDLQWRHAPRAAMGGRATAEGPDLSRARASVASSPMKGVRLVRQPPDSSYAACVYVK